MSFRTIPQITDNPVGGRKFFHYTEMEEYKFGMWGEIPTCERERHIGNAADVMRDVELFYENCMRVLVEWPNSTTHAMSTPSMNLKAWIGHASMCLCYGTPEHHTRAGWRMLSEQEQAAANDAAQRAIDTWSTYDTDTEARQLRFDW